MKLVHRSGAFVLQPVAASSAAAVSRTPERWTSFMECSLVLVWG